MNNILMPFPDKVLKQRVAKILLNHYANRWLILLIDLFLSTFAFALSYWVMVNVYQGLNLLFDIKLIG
jgi:hypothetical protein